MAVQDPTTATSAAARRVQLWAYPLIFAQRVRLNFTQPLAPESPRPATSVGAPLNSLGHQRALSDATLAVGVAPNVDTLYSVAWLDVRHHDVELTFPDFGDRYAGVQFALPDTSSILAFSGRAGHGRLPGVSLCAGPRSVERTADTIRVRSDWRYLMVVVRILVAPHDDDDVQAVWQLQDAIELTVSRRRHPPVASGDRALAQHERADEVTDPVVFGAALRQVVADGPADLLSTDRRRDVQLAGLSLAVSPERPQQTEETGRGLVEGHEAIACHVRSIGRTVNGWALNDVGVDFGDDVLLRAAVAHSQIFVNPIDEAAYYVCEVDGAGRTLDASRRSYSVTFAPGNLPPADAFWSLTMYHARGLLVDNVIDRFAVGDRTPELRFADDGSLTIPISATRPTDAANWLPAPAGEFRLMLRLYRPRTTAWDPPYVVAQDGDQDHPTARVDHR